MNTRKYRNMKPNRSSRYTEGLVCTFTDSDSRVFFFEVDKEDRDEFAGINEFYNFHKLDFVVHRTGSGGFHWLSPTMISKEKWRELHKELKHINVKCPMTTLRIEPNKYPHESVIWYDSHVEKDNSTPTQNNFNMANLLNYIWGCNFTATGTGEVKRVRYPLPLEEGELSP